MNFVACSNFRRVGSLPPVLFRSDHLGALDESDARQIRSLAIRRVLDFRGVEERACAACTLPDVTVHSLAIEPTIVRHNTHRFAQFFGHLLESNEPTVFHCTAGKDRTGMAAALLLHALGASPEEVMRDYLLTNERLKMPEISRYTLGPEAAAVLWRVQPAFLEAAFEAADQDYGGLDPYLREGLGLGEPEMERLKELYLPRSL